MTVASSDSFVMDSIIGGGGDMMFLVIENLRFQNSYSGHDGAGVRWGGIRVSFTAYNCEFGDATNKLSYGIFHNYYTDDNYVSLFRSEVHHCTSSGVYCPQNRGLNLFDCSVHDNGSHGTVVGGDGYGGANLYYSLIYNNAGDGHYQNEGRYLTVIACTIDNNTGNGLSGNVNDFGGDSGVFLNNQFTNNGAYGLKGQSGQAWGAPYSIDCNNFYNNTSGARNNANAGPNDLAVNPSYVGSGDYTPTNSAVQHS